MSVLKTTVREAVRHVLYQTGAYDLIRWRRLKAGAHSTHLEETDLKSRFSAIYDRGIWQHNTDAATPGSGLGSSLAATSALREALPALMDDLEARTLLDIGCGDFTWMQHVTMRPDYIGIDVVDSVIAQNARLYGGPGRTFAVGDATTDDLPAADVVLCREVLFHLSFVDIRKLLKNVLSKDRSYIIATSDRETAFNSDIPTGDFRVLNLEAWPLRLPPPERVIADSAVLPHRIMGVWDAQKLRRLFA